ncbi:MAG: copper amine oxidase N-terminal domain-containing protein, partial [Clostridiales bacterium]|nr:copper amine oxidase N-terminal domain-containing protein [Clostridiales bacterium]
MRKTLFVAITAIFLVFVGGIVAFASSVAVEIDGRRIAFEGQQPVIVDGRTLVPVRGVFEQLGYVVGWDESTQTAMLIGNGNTIVIRIGSRNFTTNGRMFTLDVPAQIIGGRTMLPLRFVLESVGMALEWDGTQNRAQILTAAQAPDDNPAAAIQQALQNLAGIWRQPQIGGVGAGFTYYQFHQNGAVDIVMVSADGFVGFAGRGQFALEPMLRNGVIDRFEVIFSCTRNINGVIYGTEFFRGDSSRSAGLHFWLEITADSPPSLTTGQWSRASAMPTGEGILPPPPPPGDDLPTGALEVAIDLLYSVARMLENANNRAGNFAQQISQTSRRSLTEAYSLSLEAARFFDTVAGDVTRTLNALRPEAHNMPPEVARFIDLAERRVFALRDNAATLRSQLLLRQSDVDFVVRVLGPNFAHRELLELVNILRGNPTIVDPPRFENMEQQTELWRLYDSTWRLDWSAIEDIDPNFVRTRIGNENISLRRGGDIIWARNDAATGPHFNIFPFDFPEIFVGTYTIAGNRVDAVFTHTRSNDNAFEYTLTPLPAPMHETWYFQVHVVPLLHEDALRTLVRFDSNPEQAGATITGTFQRISELFH